MVDIEPNQTNTIAKLEVKVTQYGEFTITLILQSFSNLLKSRFCNYQRNSSSLIYATNPERNALTAACVRSSAQSLLRILRTWVLTVPTVI